MKTNESTIIERIIKARERDLGGFSVRRFLPDALHPMVGPFIFFDHMGPANFFPGQGIDVRPHPHINLATVTYLFEGKIRHRDSLGSNQLIEPGAINWMTAGHGIVHSERTPQDVRESGSSLSGIQCWVALPTDQEEINPTFTHYPAHVLPEFQMENIQFKLLVGQILNHQSPVTIHSDLFYLNAKFPKGSKITFPKEDREFAAYVVQGCVRISAQMIDAYSMVILNNAGEITIEALEDSDLMFLGGTPVGKRYIYWNFVASSEEKIEKAKAEWARGPKDRGRFPTIPNDDKEFIPLPEEKGKKTPHGTVM